MLRLCVWLKEFPSFLCEHTVNIHIKDYSVHYLLRTTLKALFHLWHLSKALFIISFSTLTPSCLYTYFSPSLPSCVYFFILNLHHLAQSEADRIVSTFLDSAVWPHQRWFQEGWPQVIEAYGDGVHAPSWTKCLHNKPASSHFWNQTQVVKNLPFLAFCIRKF